MDDGTGLSERVIIVADNLQRAAGFYERVFECEVETRVDDTCRFALSAIRDWAGVEAVIRPRSLHDDEVTNMFRVESLEATIERVLSHHGKVLVGPLLADRVRLSLCQDTEGNRFVLEALRQG
jgi:predicted enzyme related to lactoylglutathione lyase